MKPTLEKIEYTPNSSLVVGVIERENRLSFNTSYHLHPEHELIWTIKSRGVKYLGNNVSKYSPGELILIGKNTPHCWITDEYTKQMVIKFKDRFFDSAILKLPEFSKIRKMFLFQQCALEFFGEAKTKAIEMIKNLPQKQGFERVICTLEALNFLAVSKTYNSIGSSWQRPQKDSESRRRTEKLYAYIYSNVGEKICLEEVGKHLGLTKSALCKYIKRSTGKTFSQIVNAVKTSKAEGFLVRSDKTITEISFLSGYEDMSNFFRQFKKQYGCTPKEYRRKFV